MILKLKPIFPRSFNDGTGDCSYNLLCFRKQNIPPKIINRINVITNVLICLQVFTYLKISYILDTHCASTDENSVAFSNSIQHPNELPIDAQNLEQLRPTGKNIIFKDDL
ncbi:hypothetical protein WUBG_13588 [Wuchereria bancrofti]|uniref:Uncharacterized protein n=1 Tax=Wuchereria bancrofti TaxID=6293 RepID=J9EJF4_WUCBA|nr:hypothetical protein WUBG_13588 [Wuchereria bancrofti]